MEIARPSHEYGSHSVVVILVTSVRREDVGT
jgi:hypothetical protein